jgi:tetratricopeptide (TPR) repeat protein
MESAEQSYQEAANWLERARFDQARDAIRRGMQQEPTHEGLRYLQALLLYREDEDEEALDAVEHLLQDAPEHHAARLLRARALRDLGRLAESERQLLELLGESPEDAELLAQYAMTLLRAGQFPKAQALVREAVRLAPEGHFVLLVAALCDMAHGRKVADSRAFDELVHNEPEAQATLDMLAYALYREHKLGPARELAEALVRLAPNDRDTVRLAAAIRYENHWSMRPLYPMMRWGWNASIGLYAAVFVLLRLARGTLPPAWLAALTFTWVGYCLYSWIWPPLFKRWRFPELR